VRVSGVKRERVDRFVVSHALVSWNLQLGRWRFTFAANLNNNQSGAGGVPMLTRTLLLAWAVFLCVACSTEDDKAQTRQVGDYFLTLRSDPASLEVGRDAEFTVHIEKDDEAQGGCRPRLRQYMPAHSLATDQSWHEMEPLEKGLYRARGSEFSMGGEWEVEVQFNCGDASRSATFSYKLVWM